MTALVTLLTCLVAPAAAQSPDAAATSPGLFGEAFEVQPTARVHVWGTAFDMDDDPQADPASYGDPENDIGFSIRRARIGLNGLFGPVFWRVSMGTGTPYDQLTAEGSAAIEIVDAYGGYAFGEDANTLLSAGIVAVPYSRESLMSSLDLVFQERGVGTRWTSPLREVGVHFDTTQGLFRGQAGVYNGNGSINGDNNNGVMAVARLELAKGDTYRTYSLDGDNAYGIAVSALYNDDVSTNTLGLNVDALGRIGPVTAMVGVTRNETSPKANLVVLPPVLDNTVALGITGQLSAYVPLRVGGLDFAARYSSIDDATALQDNGDVSIVHVGTTWRNLAPGVDLGAGYVLRLERQGRSIPNDTARVWAQFRYPFPEPTSEE